MFSKKICASLCALGMLGAVNANTEVSAANTFHDIAHRIRIPSYVWSCIKLTSSLLFYDTITRNYGGRDEMIVKRCFCLSFMIDGLLGLNSSVLNLDEAKIKTFEAIAKNDPVYDATYNILAKAPIELTDENVKIVIDSVKKKMVDAKDSKGTDKQRNSDEPQL